MTHLVEPSDRGMAIVLGVTVFVLGCVVGSYLPPMARMQAAALVLMAVGVLGLVWRLTGRDDAGSVSAGTRRRLDAPPESFYRSSSETRTRVRIRARQ